MFAGSNILDFRFRGGKKVELSLWYYKKTVSLYCPSFYCPQIAGRKVCEMYIFIFHVLYISSKKLWTKMESQGIYKKYLYAFSSKKHFRWCVRFFKLLLSFLLQIQSTVFASEITWCSEMTKTFLRYYNINKCRNHNLFEFHRNGKTIVIQWNAIHVDTLQMAIQKIKQARLR